MYVDPKLAEGKSITQVVLYKREATGTKDDRLVISLSDGTDLDIRAEQLFPGYRV